jgi:hypothetical protein
MKNSEIFSFRDFTEESYKQCLELVNKNYHVISYPDYKKEGKACLWRHDIDYSPHRALKLAELDCKYSINSYFFIWLHSDKYNFFEKEIHQIFKEISSMGLHIGLHFDIEYYSPEIESIDILLSKLSYEKRLMEESLDTEIHAFSLHNPSLLNVTLNDVEYCGMINVYNNYIKEHFKYVSDSFCFWRFERLLDILQTEEFEKIHILTHPECWTPNSLPPYQRIMRAIEGRYKKEIQNYDKILELSKIPKIKR